MSRGSGSSVISFAVFFAILLIALPAGADNVTVPETTVAPTTNITTQVTAAPANTTVPATQTAVATTQTAVATATAAATTAATTVITQPVTVVTTAQPATPTVAAATTGSVNVYSSPTGASILIDGTYCGTTPKTVNGVPAGNHILRLTLSGYNDYEGSIYIVAGQMAQGYGTLQPISQVISAGPTQTVVVPVVVTVPVTAEPTQDPGLLGNSSVIVAIIGVITAIIAAGASVFTHVKPPKKE
jgi:hypothetical protein